MNMIRFGIAAALIGGMAAGAQANEILVTGAAAKGGAGGHVALDFVSDGNATAFEFEVPVPAGAKVNTAKCLSELPATHTGGCKFNEKNNAVVVIVYSNQNDALPGGVVPIGSLAVSGVQAAELRAEKVLVSNPQGESVGRVVSSRDNASKPMRDRVK